MTREQFRVRDRLPHALVLGIGGLVLLQCGEVTSAGGSDAETHGDVHSDARQLVPVDGSVEGRTPQLDADLGSQTCPDASALGQDLSAECFSPGLTCSALYFECSPPTHTTCTCPDAGSVRHWQCSATSCPMPPRVVDSGDSGDVAGGPAELTEGRG